MIEQIAIVKYDSSLRMKYNSELHDKQGQHWELEDLKYLIDWYDIIGVEEMSLALGRTEGTVATKVYKLRKEGKMKESSKTRKPKLIKREVTKAPRKPGGGRKPSFSLEESKKIVSLRKNRKSYREIAEMYGVGISTIYRAIEKATKDPDQSIQSSTEKYSSILYHESRGVQVVG